MTPSTRRRAWAAAILCAATMLGCSDDDGDGNGDDPFLASVQGSWLACEQQPEWNDLLLVNTIADHTSAMSALVFASTDGTCTGHAVAYEQASPATFTLGGDVQASLEDRTVTARAVDVTSDGEPFFTIAWVDTAASPDVLYSGDDSADPDRDGTTAARRPVVLESRGFAAGERPAVLGFLEAVQGTWISCADEGGGEPDRRETLTIEGLVVSGASWAYASTDGSCTGAETPEGEWTGFATAGPTVAATLDGVPVTGARETDVTLGGEPTFYSILYVDTAANPDVLYTGDESADPARDATTPERRPNVLQAWRPRTKAP